MVLLTAVVGVLAAQEAPCFQQPGCKLTEMVDECEAGEADEKPEVSTDVRHRVRQPVRYQLLLPEDCQLLESGITGQKTHSSKVLGIMKMTIWVSFGRFPSGP